MKPLPPQHRFYALLPFDINDYLQKLEDIRTPRVVHMPAFKTRADCEVSKCAVISNS